MAKTGRSRKTATLLGVDLYASADDAAALLREIAHGLRAGTIELGPARKPARLRPGRAVTFEVAVAETAGPGAGKVLRVDLRWRKRERGGERLVIEGR
jgi:amphi-Trp domain-containing protein